MCSQRQWALAPDVYMLPIDARPLLGTGQPLVTLVCKTCGNVQLFNVITLGLASLLGITPAEEGEPRG